MQSPFPTRTHWVRTVIGSVPVPLSTRPLCNKSHHMSHDEARSLHCEWSRDWSRAASGPMPMPPKTTTEEQRGHIARLPNRVPVQSRKSGQTCLLCVGSTLLKHTVIEDHDRHQPHPRAREYRCRLLSRASRSNNASATSTSGATSQLVWEV